MRKLTLMRHGEAEALHPSGQDRLRRLSESGQGAATRCGQELRALGLCPDLILCSDAIRAVQTMEHVIRGGSFSGVPAKIINMLYLADPETLLYRCSEVDNQVENILLIGHNPGWSDTATLLSGTRVGLDAAEAALLEHSGNSWSQTLEEFGSWRLLAIIP